MSNDFSKTVQHPGILRHVQPRRTGIHSQELSRHCIGYVIKGKKHIYYGDVCYEASKGDMFYINSGNHYTEDIPEDGKAYEQISIFYTPDSLRSILSTLSMNFGLEVSNNHVCRNCKDRNYVIYPAWNTIKSFFTTINQYLKDGIFNEDPNAEKMKITELMYLILSNPDCCLKSKILENTDDITESFEQIIYSNIFMDTSIEELARITHKSLTSFKKEFREHFHESPHKWIIKQRLMRSRLLLISTNKPVSEIGSECSFPNTSHYIKLFKKEYGLTPSVYRNKSKMNKYTAEKQLITATAE